MTIAEAREAILVQLAHLIDEVETAEPLLARLAEAVLTGAPVEGEPSIQSLYGLIAAADESVRLPALRRIAAGEEPELSPPDQAALLAFAPWDVLPLGEVLRRVREGRRALVALLSGLPEEAWMRGASLNGVRQSVFDLAFHITQADTDTLRALAYRLHESRPYDRQQGMAR